MVWSWYLGGDCIKFQGDNLLEGDSSYNRIAVGEENKFALQVRWSWSSFCGYAISLEFGYTLNPNSRTSWDVYIGHFEYGIWYGYWSHNFLSN